MSVCVCVYIFVGITGTCMWYCVASTLRYVHLEVWCVCMCVWVCVCVLHSE